ncbi:hypothetical protein PIB30_099696, partial [Stylosanthes scabra]|nr:hypothetical protein [Stylosanthes scabra]
GLEAKVRLFRRKYGLARRLWLGSRKLNLTRAIDVQHGKDWWRHLWQHLQHFDLVLEEDLDQCDDDEYFTRFAAFVSGVLAQRRVRDIRKFHLFCSYSDKTSFHERSLNNWLLAAIGPQLQDLDLSLYMNSCISMYSCYTVPRGIFSCRSLASLTLDGLLRLENLPSVDLPALKTLTLSIKGTVPMDMIFSGCPVLEDLFLEFNVRNAPKIIVSNSLKRLSVSCGSITLFDEVEVEIDAPALEYLSFKCYVSLSRFTIKNLHNVVEAHIDFCPSSVQGDKDNRVVYIHRLLNALCRAKLLFLDSITMEVGYSILTNILVDLQLLIVGSFL